MVSRNDATAQRKNDLIINLKVYQINVGKNKNTINIY